MASTAEAGITQIYGSPPAPSMPREQTPIQGKDQSWKSNFLLSMLRSISSPAARSPRPTMRDFSPLSFSQAGMVAMSAVRLSKRKTLPHGINEWTEEVIQEKLLAVVTQVNVDVEVILQTLLPNANISLTQTAVAFMEYLPEGINSVISLQSLDQGKRWLLWEDFVNL